MELTSLHATATGQNINHMLRQCQPVYKTVYYRICEKRYLAEIGPIISQCSIYTGRNQTGVQKLLRNFFTHSLIEKNHYFRETMIQGQVSKFLKKLLARYKSQVTQQLATHSTTVSWDMTHPRWGVHKSYEVDTVSAYAHTAPTSPLLLAGSNQRSGGAGTLLRLRSRRL